MTTPARAVEADQASVAFHVALTSIGVNTIEEALDLWDGVSPTRIEVTAGSWLRRAIRLVMGRRAISRDLALSYYRLARALRTGTTIADPRKPEPEQVSLDMLREEFAALVHSEPLPGPRVDTGTGEILDEPERAASPQYDPPQGDDDAILVEEIEELEREAERLERAAQLEAQIDLEALGPNNLTRKVTVIDKELEAAHVDALREEAHRKAGSRQAATAERLVMDGARSTLYSIGSKDARVIGWIRVSKTGTPCGFCAMLISRKILYKSEASASVAENDDGNRTADPDGDADKYHDNCHCYAEPVYSPAQYTDSPLFALNREYADLWPTVTKGYGGVDALNKWRTFIRAQNKANAQAAKASLTTNAQEA